jgi:hypothetical protein
VWRTGLKIAAQARKDGQRILLGHDLFQRAGRRQRQARSAAEDTRGDAVTKRRRATSP